MTFQDDMMTDGAERLAARLVSPSPASDPWSIYRRLNEISPVTHVNDIVVATGYAEVSEVLKNKRYGQGQPEDNRVRQDPRFSGSRYLQSVASSVVMVDPPAHTRLRRVLNQIFTPRAIKDVEPHVAKVVDKLIGDIEGAEQADLKGDFAAHLPMSVIGHLVGFPEEDHEQLFAWGHRLEHASTPFVSDEDLRLADEAVLQMDGYADELLRSRRDHPRDDMLTQLVEATAADGMTTEEFTTQLLALIIAGTQTTVHMITSGVVALYENRDQLERFRRDPSLDATGVEEILRYYPPLHTAFPRIAMEDVELGGHALAEGTKIFPFVAAANRDPKVFDDADRLILHRENTKPPQLSFGHGIHLCVGRALARVEGRIALRRLIDRFPNMEVDPAEAEPWATAMARGHARVPATLHG